MSLRIAGIRRSGRRRDAPQREPRDEQSEAGDRQQARLFEQGGVQAVIEMGDEAEQAQDPQRGQDPVADGKAQQQSPVLSCPVIPRCASGGS